ncbi:serine/threonine-protein kinase BLUS1-like [Corylus avellana]|uniref:serine/threonine-protein kinase BLUS1-like n=1 Tax=Corylus avellana TaxID=13451 RepID=UPI00286BC178|nr:serine/threonine-protein kinase BLUS1-like [Corylus avellana]
MAHEEEEPKKIPDEDGDHVVYKAICLPMNSMVMAIKATDLDQSRPDLENVGPKNANLWVVTPINSAGSLQSIISSSFPDGLSEPCIAIVLKQTLSALSNFHSQDFLHGDIKASNILIDSNGSVKLASSSLMLTHDVAGAPYWMAPEVINSQNNGNYSLKVDMWSFGITALELARGRPPLSRLPPSNHNNFSEAFKDMVASCLHQDPSKRPSAETLLKHSFFENCRGSDFLVKNVLQGLPPSDDSAMVEGLVALRRGLGEQRETVSNLIDLEMGREQKMPSDSARRIISGWNFNEERFELDPVFQTESTTIIEDKRGELGETGELIDHSDQAEEAMMEDLDLDDLKLSLYLQMVRVENLIFQLREKEEKAKVIERQRVELEYEKEWNLKKLEMDLEDL